MSKFRQIKGHKLIRSWSGANSGYANGRCECGKWFWSGWTDKMSHVIQSHHNHVDSVRQTTIKFAP